MTVRSHIQRESLAWSSPRRITPQGVEAKGVFALSGQGLLCVGVEDVRWESAGTVSSSQTFPTSSSPAGFSYTSWGQRWQTSREGFWATHYVDWQPAYRNHQWMVRLPWWPVWTFTLAIVGVYYLLVRRLRLRETRLRDGLCIACGYDLRASCGRCPECGRAAEMQELHG